MQRFLMVAVAAASVSASAHVVWQIGVKDGTGNEFALAPRGYNDFLQHDFGWDSFLVDAREVLKGGTLELWMSPEPNREWGL